MMLALSPLLLPCCQPASPLSGFAPDPARLAPPISSRETPIETQPTPLPLPPAISPAISRKTISGIEFEGVAFDSRTHRLAVVDQPKGPGSLFATAAEAAGNGGTLLAINAGFFTPEGKPLGLVVSDGKAAGSWNSASSLGNGIFKESHAGVASISRRGSRSAANDASQLIQAGPLLLENGSRISGLDNEKSALRSIILTDGGSRWWIGKTSSCTLAALGNALASGSPAPWEIHDALNLDGGRSTDLFISPSIPGGPIHRRSFLNRPVRNFLILKRR